MVNHLLLQLNDMLLQVEHYTVQFVVLCLQVLNFVLKFGDSLELPLAALGGGHPIP